MHIIYYIRTFDISNLKLQTCRVSSTELAKREGFDHDLRNMGAVEHKGYKSSSWENQTVAKCYEHGLQCETSPCSTFDQA